MRFSWEGGMIQQSHFAEGGILKELSLLEFHESQNHVDMNSTLLLSEMFSTEPPMEELYPLLVEFTMRFKFPKMVKRVDIEKKLLAVGMTNAGLEKLNLMLRNHYRIWDSDF
jgi:hypothetical protein